MVVEDRVEASAFCSASLKKGGGKVFPNNVTPTSKFAISL